MIPGQDAAIEQWRLDAIADGWKCEPIYKYANGETAEPEETAAKLTRDGWVVDIFNRPDKPDPRCRDGVDRGDKDIATWGPDSLAVDVPDVYSFKELEHNAHKCMYCGGFFDDTVRIGFAGRCCQPCRVKNVASVEYNGWCN